MDVISGRAVSGLNPDAPPFVPWAYRAVEDYSDEWWELVRSSTWFRDYWLRECFEDDDENAPGIDDIYDLVLPDDDSFFHSYPPPVGEEGKKAVRMRMELAAWGAEKWRGARDKSDGQKQWEKAPKMVSVRVSPRTIQQPR